MLARSFATIALLAAVAFFQADTQAQSRPVANVCQVARPALICTTAYGQLGTACQCSGSAGRIISPPPDWGNTCSTRSGVCTVNYQKIGAACGCSNDPGRIVRR